MKNEQFSFSFKVYSSIDELTNEDAELLKEARAATNNAYAPYSNFFVGAAARLTNGKIVCGSNQENASFPAGICAERTLLSTISSQFPGVAIEAIAISYDNRNIEMASNKPISPCGICRQTLVEYEQRQEEAIKLILGGLEGEIYVIKKAGMLLPLSFEKNDMKPQP